MTAEQGKFSTESGTNAKLNLSFRSYYLGKTHDHPNTRDKDNASLGPSGNVWNSAWWHVT